MHRTQSATELVPVLVEQVGTGAEVWLRKNITTTEIEIGDGLLQTMWEADEVTGSVGAMPSAQEVAAAFEPLWAELDRQEAEGAHPSVESVAAVVAASASDVAHDEGELFSWGSATLRATSQIMAGEAVIVGTNAEEVGMLDALGLLVTELYEQWSGDGVSYATGTVLGFGGDLYRVLQAHTSQPDWAPDVAVSLFAKVLVGWGGGSDEPKPWVQPGSTNPYMRGDKVTHVGHTWESNIDNNVWEPGVYGWDQLV